MSLDNIQIPAIVLQDLFKDSLVDLKTDEHAGDLPSPSQLSFLGTNLQRVVIVVNNSNATYLPDEELNFLLGILSACKLSMADVALLNLSKNKAVNYNMIADELYAEKIFLFGVEPSALQLPLQFPHYQVQKYNSQVYLSSPDLSTLSTDRAEKTKLWNCLKQVFNIA